MKKFSLLIALICISLLSFTQVVEHIYDFNSLQTDNLNGQDEWLTIQHTSGGADIFIDLIAGNVVSPDGSKAAFYNASGPGYGRTATRKSSPNFNFDLSEGDIIELEIEMHRNYWGMFFGAGFDADGDGHIAPGLSTEEFDGGIELHLSAQNPDNNKVVLPNGESVIFSVDNSGWCSYRMVIDFLENDEAGAVALFYDQGVTGVWEPVPEIQGVNMGLTPGSGDKQDRTTWDGIFFHSQGGTGGYDNIIVREPDITGQQQYINFPSIADRFNTAPPFTLEATATSGLTVNFSMVDGPATINGNVLTLTGETGFVTVMASQPGDTTWAAAPDVTQTFEVIDPLLIYPQLNVLNAVDEQVVRAPGLHAINLSASTAIEYPHLLSVNKVEFVIGGETIIAEPTKNGFFIASWSPPAFGSYTMTTSAFSSEGPVTSEVINFEVVEEAPELDINILDMFSFQNSNTLDTSVILPSFSGTYSRVMAYLEYDCPCDPWDRIANIEIRGAGGEYMELLRYITPYGVACNDGIDITDFVSQLQGKVDFHFSFTQSYVSLRFVYETGTPTHPYSWVYKLWDGSFPFGDMENLQPMEIYDLNISEGVEDAYLRIVSSGHGWGDNNTGNAAEFYNATHHIKVNGSIEFDQNLWQDCNPNPANCQPQNGTWYFDRAGWCPGSIPILYRYHLQPYLGGSNMEIQYLWDPDYVDYCHPSNPDCESGVTCPDCNSGFDPHIVVAGEFIVFSNDVMVNVKEPILESFDFTIVPNPSSGIVNINFTGKNRQKAIYSVVNLTGQELQEGFLDESGTIDLSPLPGGLYLIKVSTPEGYKVRKLMLE